MHTNTNRSHFDPSSVTSLIISYNRPTESHLSGQIANSFLRKTLTPTQHFRLSYVALLKPLRHRHRHRPLDTQTISRLHGIQTISPPNKNLHSQRTTKPSLLVSLKWSSGRTTRMSTFWEQHLQHWTLPSPMKLPRLLSLVGVSFYFPTLSPSFFNSFFLFTIKTTH